LALIAVRLNSLVKKPISVANSCERGSSGAKAPNCFAAVTVRSSHPSDEDLSPGTLDFHPSDEDLSPGTPDFHPSDEDLSPGTLDFHPSDEDLSPGTPDFHPSDEDLSPGTPDWSPVRLIW